jgi:hypothetical protein
LILDVRAFYILVPTRCGPRVTQAQECWPSTMSRHAEIAGAGSSGGEDVNPDTGIVAALLQKSGTTIECELHGQSMDGTLPDGSRIRLVFEEQPALCAGDVIAFVAGNAVVVHRIVARGRFGRARSFVLTRGDSAVLLDHPVHVRSVLGTVREWTQRGDWNVVRAPSAPRWRRLLSSAFFWPTFLALHVDHRLAKISTIASVVARNTVVRKRVFRHQ